MTREVRQHQATNEYSNFPGVKDAGMHVIVSSSDKDSIRQASKVRATQGSENRAPAQRARHLIRGAFAV